MYYNENYVILIEGEVAGITHSIQEAEEAIKAFEEQGYKNVSFKEVKEINLEEEYTHYILSIPVDSKTSVIDIDEFKKITFVKGNKTDEEFGSCLVEHMDNEKYELGIGNKITKTFQIHKHKVTVSWSSKEKYDVDKIKGVELRQFASEMAKKFSDNVINLDYKR